MYFGHLKKIDEGKLLFYVKYLMTEQKLVYYKTLQTYSRNMTVHTVLVKV